jgi:OFA family oxalate/formate antiporter-like MFS transporter
LLVGFVPAWLLLARRPEDLGLSPDGMAASATGTSTPTLEGRFSRAQAVRTPAFWLLMLYTVLVYPVQAGVSLHQAPHFIERGISPTAAAAIVSFFSLMSGLAVMACGVLPRRLPTRFALALAGELLTAGALLMTQVASPLSGYVAGGAFGLGVGGILTLLPIAWANYFGRENFGAIRGLALSAQVLAQAAGPLLSGVLHDTTGDYLVSLQCFAALSVLSIAAALAARPPTAAGVRS